MTVLREQHVSRGRPRSEAADRAIAEAALDVLADSGIAAFSVEAVAQRAGVGKATIYRRFDGRDALLAAALDRLRDDMPPRVSGGTARERLEAQLELIRTPMANSRNGRVMAQVISAGAHHPEFLSVFYDRVFGPRRAALTESLRQGVVEGWVDPTVDLDAAVTMLVGSMIFLKVWQGVTPGQPSTAEIVAMALQGISARASDS